jgi:hypothetical protein
MSVRLSKAEANRKFYSDHQQYETKDSGKRAEYASGMVRDTEEGKARFGLLFPKGVPYANQMLTRFAELMARGAQKYTERNWEKAEGPVELERYRSSALRHLVQWVTGEDDEDHAAAVMFNILAGETVKFKMERKPLLSRINESATRLMKDAKAVLEDAMQCRAMAPDYLGGPLVLKCVGMAGHEGQHRCDNVLDGEGCLHQFETPEEC